MKNAAKGKVRYGAKLFLLTLILTVMSFVAASAQEKMTGTGNFYYQRNGSEVVISNSGTISAEKGGTIFIACYDGEVLDCVKMIKADEMISEFYVREFTMKLSDDVENLKVKAFAWDSASAMTPLCDAKDISETPGDVMRAEGRVVSTYKTDMALSSNRARIEIQNSEYPNGYVYIANISLTADIDERILELLEIDYIVDEEDTMVVLGYSSSSKNNCIDSNVNLYAGMEADYWIYPPTYNDTASSPRINIYNSETASSMTSYKLDTDAALFVNGVQCAVLDMNGDSVVTKAEMDSFSQSCDLFVAGDFCVIDTPLMGEATADKKYDFIKAEFYGTAVVQSVMDKADGTKRIAFEYCSSDINRPYLDINEDVVYKFTDTDGNSMTVEDIQTNDVLSIKYRAGNYSYSSFYEIIVSRNTVEGYVSGTYAQNGRQYYTVGGKNYRMADNIYPDPMSVGSTYRLYLDKNGNIAKTKETQLARKYAIVERFYTYAGELWVRLVLSDGKKYNYAVEQDNTAMSTLLYDSAYPLICEGKEIEITDSTNPVATLDRFVKYSVSDDGVTLDSLLWSEKASTVSEYNSVSQRIGSYGISSDETVILDATDFAVDTREDVAVIDYSELDETTEYTAVFVGGRVINDFAYPMVVLLRAEKLQLDSGSDGTETSGSEMIVAAANVSSISENGEAKNQIKIYTGPIQDIQTEYLITTDLTVGAGIQEGDAFIYTTNSDGEVDNVTKIFSVADNKSNMLAAVGQIVVDTSIDVGDSKFYMYPVVKKYAGSIALASDIYQMSNYGLTYWCSSDTGITETYANDVNVYQYDGTTRVGNRVSLTTPSGVVASAIATSGKLNNGLTIDWNSSVNAPAYAVYRMVDGDICELYSIYFE